MRLKKNSVRNYIETLTDDDLKNVIGGYNGDDDLLPDGFNIVGCNYNPLTCKCTIDIMTDDCHDSDCIICGFKTSYSKCMASPNCQAPPCTGGTIIT